MEKVGKYRLFHYICGMTTQKIVSEIEGKIYTLIDPITDKIRYVGMTKLTLRHRLSLHMSDTRGKTHKGNWIKGLKKLGLKPIIRQIDFAYDLDSLVKKEIFWIKHHFSVGTKLTNHIIEWSPRPYKSLDQATARRVIQYDLEGNKVAEYASAIEAACAFNCCDQNGIIYTICNGKEGRYTFKGFIFRFEGDSVDKYKRVKVGVHKTSNEHRKYLSKKAKERNKKFTRAHYVKASSMIKNRKGTPRKVVIKIDTKEEFGSIMIASEKTGVPKTTISRHCRNTVKKPLFIFKDIVHS